jgi:cell division protein FtsL
MIKIKKHPSSLKLRSAGIKKYWWNKFSIFKINAALLVLWIIAVAAYVAILNDMTVKSYQTKKLNKQLSDLTSGNKDLGLSLSDKQSMETISEKIKSLGMVEAGSVKYVSVPPAVMVKK